MAMRIKATDLYVLTECNRQVYLDYHGDPADRVPLAPYYTWLIARGLDFEQQVIASLGVSPLDFPTDDLDAGFQQTLALMRQGIALIYQGVLIHGNLVGQPDLLQRVPGASRFGPYFYRPIDVKSASRAERGHRLQVMAYIALLEAIQGARPDGALWLRPPVGEESAEGDHVEEIVKFDERLYQEALEQVLALAAGREPLPFVSSVCNQCAWQEVCRPIAERQQDVSLIPGLRRATWDELHARGLGTLRAVAGLPREVLLNVRGIGEKTADFIRLQAQALVNGQVIQIAPPPLRPADPAIFFDVESLPGEGLFYLMGTLIRQAGRDSFACDLARQPEDEGAMWQSFLTRMDALAGPVYHYGVYERTAVRRLADKHSDGGRAGALLDRMIDLERALRDSVVLPLSGYSLKEVGPWLGFEWTGQTGSADEAMIEYLGWLDDGDPAHLSHILRYNEDDCRATAAVYDWLLSLAPNDL